MHPLIDRITRGDRRAVARALTMLENDHPDKRELLQGLYPFAGRAHIVGFTGAPGAGKSTLVDRVIAYLRKQGKTVGVLAVDPSSPFTGGALLGDRIRMTAHSADDGVYIRSMGSRGSLGGLGKSSRDMLYVLEAFGCDAILLETVGVGQSELDVMSVADTVALVLTPGAGDSIQTAKAGIMEIADVFVINKSDLPGADTLVREVQLMLHEKSSQRENWEPPIVQTTVTDETHIDPLWMSVERHRQHLLATGFWEERLRHRHREETLRILDGMFHGYVSRRALADPAWRLKLDAHLGLDPYSAAEQLRADLPWLDV